MITLLFVFHLLLQAVVAPVTVIVRDSTGKPVEGLAVRLYESDSREVVKQCRTSSIGRCDWNVDAGLYSFEFDSPNTIPQEWAGELGEQGVIGFGFASNGTIPYTANFVLVGEVIVPDTNSEGLPATLQPPDHSHVGETENDVIITPTLESADETVVESSSRLIPLLLLLVCIGLGVLWLILYWNQKYRKG